MLICRKQNFGFLGGGNVVLTARQKEFLDVLKELGKDKRGVHYTEVATHLGVSKWTAYDILSEMVEKGYVRVKREKKGSSKGRAKVLFFPNEPEKSENLWEHYLDELHEKDYHTLLKDVMNELKTVTQPLSFCMGAVLLFLLLLKTLNTGNNIGISFNNLLSLLSSSEIILVVFASFIASAVMHPESGGTLPYNLINELSSGAQKIDIVDEEFVEELKGFSDQLINRLWPKKMDNSTLEA